MIIYTKRDGYRYEDERTGRKYSLLEMKTYGGMSTSDIIMIWDEETDAPANWVYGASLYEHDAQKLDELIREYIEANQKRKRETVATYGFTRSGVNAFMRDVTDDILDRDICEWFALNHAGREIRIPDTAMAYEALEVFLQEAIDDWEGKE